MNASNLAHRIWHWKYFANVLRPRKRIYLLSHMRANTSLLGHILGSHPHIEGYYELQRSYLKNIDLLLNKRSYYYHNPAKKGARFIFDKLLHNHRELSGSMVSSNDRVIFMIREPAPTIASIVSLFRDRPGREWASIEGAEKYYNNRLSHLRKLSFDLKGQYIFLKAEDLVEEPDLILEKLTSYLGLRKPLSKNYEIFSKTGHRGAGDSSERIKAGTVLAKPKDQQDAIKISEGTLSHYQDVLRILRDNALHTY